MRPAVALAIALAAVTVAAARAQEPKPQRIPITGDRLSGSVLPIAPLDGDIELAARRGTAWTVADTKRLLLEGDVVVTIDAHRFTADNAVVWINRLPTAEGVVTQVAVFFDRVKNYRHRAGIGVAGEELLITASARGAVRLEVALLDRDERPPADPLIGHGEQRLALHLRKLLGDPPRLAERPQVDRPPAPSAFAPEPGRTIQPADFALPTTIDLPSLAEARPWLRDPGATLRFRYGELKVTPGESENTITIIDSVVVEYFAQDLGEDISQLTLSAERAVLFTDPGPLEEMAAWEMSADKVRGIYLEGNVSVIANRGDYTIRAPRIYYDFENDQAIMLDAVLRTYDRQLDVPIYARAAEMRQVARNQWDARSVRVSTSEFRVAHLALGAQQMTITQPPAVPGAEDEPTRLDASNITLRAGNFPFFYWPSFSGKLTDVPLRRVKIGHRENDGVRIETEWDLFSLLGTDRPDGIEAILEADVFTERGEAAGLRLEYGIPLGLGRLELYGLADDGVDLVSTGAFVDANSDYRGLAIWEHTTKLSDNWLFQGQASFISDEIFISGWRPTEYANRREYETSAYFKRQKGTGAFTALGRYELNGFISNDYLLASTQYKVDKWPEVTLRRYGEAIFDDSAVYSGETRAGRMRIVPQGSSPREIGVNGNAFGTGPDDQFIDVFRARGVPLDFVSRFDTRHELMFPNELGILDVTPFFVGRITAYSDDFDAFSQQSDSTRVFGAAGVRVGTKFQRVDNDVENRVLDLHRLRHIVEPNVTVWYGYSDVSEDDLPVYDLEVESLGTGAAVKMGVRNTIQTQRGGPGRWRSVDVLTLDTDFVLNSGDVNTESPTPQFFDYRPEYSQFGNHARAAGAWLISDTLSVTGEMTYDFDDSQIERGSIGTAIQHSPVLSFAIEYRFIQASRSQLLGVGWYYQITPKYFVAMLPEWDFQKSTLRGLSFWLTRSFPNFDIVFQARHDDILDETTFGASLGLVRF